MPSPDPQQPLPQQFDQTPPPAGWRDDVIEVAITAAVLFAAALVAGIVLIAAGILSTLLSFGFYLLALFILTWLPFAMLGAMKAKSVSERHRLAWTRSQAERWTLLSMLDADMDGDTEADEIAQFVKYARRLWQGMPTTSAEAQRMGIPGPIWQRYRNALLAMGLAEPVGKKGGLGFELRDGVRQTPWPRIEKRIMGALLKRTNLDIMPLPEHYSRNVPAKLGVGGGGDGIGESTDTRTHTQTRKGKRPQVEPVSTLPPDVSVGPLEEWD